MEEKSDFTIAMQKKAFRKERLKLRDALPKEMREAADEARLQKLLGLSCFQKAERILCYVSFKSEADTHQILAKAFRDGRLIAVPKVVGRDMEFYEIGSMEELEPGSFGVLEPKAGTRRMDLSDANAEGTVILVPGAAFDPDGGRIGYGGGYYDRFFAAFPRAVRIALAYEAQLCESVICDDLDAKMDYIVTEQQVYCCKNRE